MLLCAHLDTVFGPEVPHAVVRHGGRLSGPGVGDNTVAVCALSVLDALLPARLRYPVWIVATTGEEGLGNLAGVRALLDDPPGPVRAVIALEGNYLGPGERDRRGLDPVAGHGHRAGRARLGGGQPAQRGARGGPADHRARRAGPPGAAGLPGAGQPGLPKTTVNVGLIEGGESVNSRARQAGFLVNLRSGDPAALDALRTAARAVLEDPAVPLGISVHEIGERPAGQLDPDHPLATLAADVLREAGIPPRLTAASTDANAAYPRGIPALTLGITTGEGTHTEQEWIDVEPGGGRAGRPGGHGRPTGRTGVVRTVRTGVTLQGVDPPADFEEMVTEIETLGYDNLWLTDSSLHSRNCWAYLTLAARQTSRMAIGTAVTNPVTRHPAITAVAAATVAEISGGRVILGIGAGDRPLLSLGYTPARLATLEASIAAIRALWSGAAVDADGPGFALHDAHYRFPPGLDIPVWVSATGPRTLELAGRVADGVILLAGLHPDGISFALEHIDRGAEAAGRSERPPVTVFAYGAISEDEEAAIAAARTIAAWFPQTAPVHCRLAGLPQEIIDQVRGSYAGGEFQEAARAAEALPVEFVKRMALAGGRDEARQHLRDLAGLGVDSVTVFPLGADRMATIRAFADCVAAEAALT